MRRMASTGRNHAPRSAPLPLHQGGAARSIANEASAVPPDRTRRRPSRPLNHDSLSMLLIAAATLAAAPQIGVASEAAPTSSASLHPADAAFYAAIPDMQAVIAAYPKSALARLLADPELHQAVGDVMNPTGTDEPADPVAPLGLLMDQYAGMVASGDFPPVLELGAGLKSVSFSFAVPNGDIWGMINELNGLDYDARDAFVGESIGLRLVMDFVDQESCARAAETLSGLMGDSPPWNTELQSRGISGGSTAVTAWSFVPTSDEHYMDPMQESMTLVAGGSRMAFIAGNVDLGAFVPQMLASADPSAAEMLVTEGRAALGAAPGTTIMEAHFRPFIVQMLLDEEPMVVPALDILEGLVGPAASMAIRGGYWRISFDDESGQFVTQGVHPKAEAGPLSGLLGASVVREDALTLAHPDAMATTITSMDKSVLRSLVQSIADENDPDAFDELEAEYGFRPDRDLIDNLGGALGYSLAEIKSLVAAPNLMFAVQLEDAEAFKAGMDGLFRMISEEGDGLEISRREYKRISTLYEISIADLIGDAAEIPGVPIDLRTFIRPTIAVVDDRAVLTMTAGYAKKEVRRIQKLQDSDGAEPELHAGIAGLAASTDGATALTHANWGALIAGLYNTGKALAPMIAGAAGGDLPFDPTALPSADLITRYFRPTQRVVRFEGDAVVHEVRSSFGPETTLTPFLGVFGVGTMTVRPAPVAIEAAPDIAPAPSADHDHEGGLTAVVDMPEAVKTDQALVQVDVALTIYRLDHKAYPADLAALLKGDPDTGEPYIDGGVPKDAWGNELVYVVDAEKGTYQLRSKGPNGVDDKGAGDDIVME